MMLSSETTDDAVLAELGQRLAARRASLRLTQAELAQQAGLGKRTVERIEAGHSAQLSSWIRLLRVLDLLPALDVLLPQAAVSPMALLDRRGRPVQRVRERDSNTAEQPAVWTWGDQ
ncbi:MAG: helix-turn-helix transcriptional regulator [Wenzhouxiangella sp.]